jgi:hypothetical protein
MVHLDVDARGAWRVGLEFGLERAPQVRGVLRERGLFEELARRGLCLPAKRDGVARWPGAAAVWLPGERTARVVTRWVNHVKLVFRPGEAPRAKVYLATRNVYRTHPTLARARAAGGHPGEHVGGGQPCS